MEEIGVEYNRNQMIRAVYIEVIAIFIVKGLLKREYPRATHSHCLTYVLYTITLEKLCRI